MLYKTADNIGDGNHPRKGRSCIYRMQACVSTCISVISADMPIFIKEDCIVHPANEFACTPALCFNEYFEKAKQIYGLYKFLNDEGNMKDKKYIEANLWKEYLVAASFFGIADKVAKQMSRIIPEMPEDISAAVSVARCCESFGHARSAAAAEARRSAGGGGSSSFGGGGSFSSGGGGGGVR